MVRLSVSLASRTHSRARLMNSLLEGNGACSQPEMNAGAASQQQGHRDKQAFRILFLPVVSDVTIPITTAPFRSHLITFDRNKSGCHTTNGGDALRETILI